MTQRKPVMFLNPFSGVGGAERSLLGLIAGLGKERWDPLLVCPAEGELSKAAARLDVPVKLHPYPPGMDRIGCYSSWRDLPSLARAMWNFRSYLAGLRKLVSEHSSMLIHANGAKAQLAASLAMGKGIPVLWHWRDLSHPGFRQRIFRWAERHAAIHVTNSEAVARSLASFRAPVRCIYNPIDVEEFRPGLPPPEDEAFPRFDGGERVLGLFSILAPPKGIAESLELFFELARRHGELHLLVVGDEIYRTAGHRGYRASLEERVEKQGMGARVHFVGYRDDVARCMAATELCLHLPTRPEPFGRVVAEAMACGLPVVAHDEGGIPEIIRHGETGILVPPRDREASLRAIEKLLNDPPFMKELGEAGRRSVVERFSPRVHVESMERLYDELLEKSRPGD